MCLLSGLAGRRRAHRGAPPQCLHNPLGALQGLLRAVLSRESVSRRRAQRARSCGVVWRRGTFSTLSTTAIVYRGTVGVHKSAARPRAVLRLIEYHQKPDKLNDTPGASGRGAGTNPRKCRLPISLSAGLESDGETHLAHRFAAGKTGMAAKGGMTGRRGACEAGLGVGASSRVRETKSRCRSTQEARAGPASVRESTHHLGPPARPF